jgi:hypothetical protein
MNSMHRIIILLLAFSASLAHAGASFHLEHPRSPSQRKDHYKISCEKECALEIQSMSSSQANSKSEIYQEKINELLSMKTSGELPESKSKERVLYKVKASDGKSKLDLILGFPLSYQGKEYQKYVKTIEVIEEIRRSMTLELSGSKK